MAISNTTASAGPFTPNGVTTAFPYTFAAMSAAEVAVVRISATSGIQTALTGWTATYGVSGGTVTFLVAPAAGDPIYVLSAPSFAQQADFQNQGAFLPATINSALDRAAARDISLRDQLRRTASYPLGVAPYSKVAGWDAAGSPALYSLASVAGATGAPGGNVMAAGLFTDAWSAVGAGTNVIRTTGYSIAGKGGAWYVRDGTTTWSTQGTAYRTAAIAAGIAAATVDASLVATEGRWRKADASGQYWTLMTDQFVVSTMFGAKHDASYNAASAWNVRWTGTDDLAAIQAMIDLGIYFGGNKNWVLADGGALLGNTLHIGYGKVFSGGRLTGLSPSFIGAAGGTTLVRNFVGKPLINVQGARSVVLDLFATRGVHDKYFSTNGFAGFGQTCVTDDTILDNWFDPTIQTALGRSVDYRYAPDAAITVDAYSGSRPATSYPDAVYPAWLGAESLVQWDGGTPANSKYYSSDVNIFPTQGMFWGEINGYVTQPSGADGNGDFVRCGNVTAVSCKRVASYSQTQSRSGGGTYVSIGQCGEVFTNNAHGVQNGNINGTFTISGSGLIKFGTINSTGASGPLTIDAYVEAMHILMSTGSAGGVASSIVIKSRNIDFNMNGSAGRPHPLWHIEGMGATVTFDGGDYSGFNALLTCQASVNVINSAVFNSALTGSFVGSTTSPLAAFNNATGGIVSQTGVLGFNGTTYLRDLDSGAGIGRQNLVNGYRYTGRSYGLPMHLDFASAGATWSAEIIPGFRPHVGATSNGMSADASSFTAHSTASSAAGFEWTFTHYDTGTAELQGGAAGDLLYHSNSQMWFYVRSYTRATNVCIARALTGIKLVGGVWVPLPTFATTGTMSFHVTRRYIPNAPLLADFSTASPNLTNVMRPDGGAVGAVIAVGDYLDLDFYNDGIMGNYAAGMALTAFNSAAKTATVVSNPSRTETRHRINRLVRTVANG